MVNYLDISLYQHCVNLFPINRSLMGEGTRSTLKYFEDFVPSFERIQISSGTEIFDWQVPLEWKIEDAYIEHILTGQRYAEFKKNNLHIVGYSEPIDLEIDFEILKKNIFFLDELPTAIPYRTSYYNRDWGFCISKDDFEKMPSGLYKVIIKSSFVKGNLDLSHCLNIGKSSKEIMFTSYVCHPSMANNELSGPVVLAALVEYINKYYPNNYYTYRFILGPETLGTVAYLSRYFQDMKLNLKAGFVLTCLGDNGPLSIVNTPFADTFADEILVGSLKSLPDKLIYSFLERGSDERQYCSPNINLPVCTITRSKFGTYKEYHTSLDNLDFINNKSLEGSLSHLKRIIDVLESGIYIKSKVFCEPQLGKRNLYRNFSLPKKSKTESDRLNLIAYSNGKTSLFKICEICSISLETAIEEVDMLVEAGILIRSNNIIL